jgi:flagellar biosynthesis component FlhA
MSALRTLATFLRSHGEPEKAAQALFAAQILARRVPSGRLESQLLQDSAQVAEDLGKASQAVALRRAGKQAVLRGFPLRIIVGPAVVHFFDSERGGVVLDEITRIRAELSKEDDWTMPSVRLSGDPTVPDRGYTLLVWGAPVYQGVIPGDFAFFPPSHARGGVLSHEPGYEGRVEWATPARHQYPQPADGGILPGVVVANNVKELVRLHRAQIDAGEQPPHPKPGLDDISVEELIDFL